MPVTVADATLLLEAVIAAPQTTASTYCTDVGESQPMVREEPSTYATEAPASG